MLHNVEQPTISLECNDRLRVRAPRRIHLIFCVTNEVEFLFFFLLLMGLAHAHAADPIQIKEEYHATTSHIN